MDNNLNKVDTNALNKPGLVTDLDSSYINGESYSHARNIIRASKEGSLGTLGNEPSTIKSYSAPYKIIGIIDLPDGKHLVFSTDNINSEIGVGDPSTDTYTKLLNKSCLNFNTDYQITGKARKDFNKSTIVYFTDKYNPFRRIDLLTLPKIKDCDEILLFKNIQHPCISTKQGFIGNLPNGAYSAAIAYTIDGKIYSDWYSISNRKLLYSDNNTCSLDVSISDIDTEFDEFALCIVANYIDPVTKGATKVAKIVGYYSTKVKSITVTDINNTTFETINLSDLVIKKNTWVKGGIISSNSNTLILGDLVRRDEENYQLKAFEIEAEYVVTQAPIDYYENDGDNIGYYRDENYDFYIQGVYKTGELTDKYHVAGRKANAKDRDAVSSADVYELDKNVKDCDIPEKIQRWMIENTAGKMRSENNEFSCGIRVIGRGEMGYFESTDLYPDNEEVYGENANKPIRYHKFPDEEKVPRYSIVDGKTYINILGVRFKNIPKFSDPDIIGYKITRSDRKGGNGTVVSRGLITNMRAYVDKQTNEEILYSNYTVNDLSPDVYISAKQTVYKSGRETNFVPLSEYKKDTFTFYSPHTLFEPRYSIGNELKVECEEVAEITGQFEIVKNHPKLKLLNQFSFWAALAIGSLEAFYQAKGLDKQVTESVDQASFGNVPTTGTVGDINFGFNFQTSNLKTQGTNISNQYTLLSLSFKGIADIIQELSKVKDLPKKGRLLKQIKLVLQLIGRVGISVTLQALTAIKYANEVLDIINGFTANTDYVLQYNASAEFRKSTAAKTGNKRRAIIQSKYLPSQVVSIDNETINNFKREKGVYLKLNKEIIDPSTKDNSRNTISGFGICNDINQKVKSQGSAYYVTNKVNNRNQYGRLGSSSPVSMHSCVLNDFKESPVLYGGDCIIARMYFLKKMQFFNQNLANANFPDGIEYDYRLYRNIGYPRYWLDSTKYDFSEIFTLKTVNFSTFNRTTANKHNLDCKKSKDGKTLSRIDDAYMYLSNNCAIDFICEVDYNISFREESEHPFYYQKNKTLSKIFASDKLDFDEEFKINRVYSDLYTTEIFAPQQRSDFDPKNPIPVNEPNSVIYSLPAYNLQKIDNWQYFLPLNFFNFSETDFGKLTGIHQIDQDRLMFLFTKASPFVSMGRSLLKLSGQTVTIGDGGLFAQDPREIMPTTNNFGASSSRLAFASNQFGRFYISEKQGKILSFGENLDDISMKGISFWCKNYMPIFLYKYFPSYTKDENTISGVGYQIVFDNFYETLYISKRDFVPVSNEIICENNEFFFRGVKVSLRDSKYFKDVSWTLSYSPMDKAFVSWHDWHPDLVVQGENHFYSVKDKTLWKHNESYESFCNFYDVEYPFEIEPISATGQNVEIIRSLEYILEVYKYKNFGRDRFHVHHENFSNLIVHNSEQISPLLNLSYGNPDPEQNLKYPKKSTNLSYDIVFFKEENKYRVNQFWDITKDRGEFTNNEYHLFPTDESGYKNVINPVAINIDKPEEQRKKFRHYFTKFRLIKSISGSHKFIFKILNIKKLISLR